MRQTRKTELLVGGFVLASIIAVLVMIIEVADVRSFGSSETYSLKAALYQFNNKAYRKDPKFKL